MAASNAREGIGEAVAKDIGIIVESIARIGPKAKVKGDQWELWYYGCMRIHTKAAINYNDDRMSIAKLLGIVDFRIIPYDHRELFFDPLYLYSKNGPFEKWLTKNSYNDMKEVRQDIFTTDVIKSYPVTFIHPAEKKIVGLVLGNFCG